MKKILLYIGSMYIGGAQRVMANLANYFCADGYDVVLVNEIVPIKYRWFEFYKKTKNAHF